MPGRSTTSRHAFTLIEALLALSIVAVSGAAILLGVANSIQATDAILEQAVAGGMAQQLMDEIAAQRYCEPGTDPFGPLGPEASETGGPGRSLFDDIDDYHGLVLEPPQDRWGVPLGRDDGRGGVRHPGFQPPAGYFDRWRQTVEVHYVGLSDPSVPLPAGTSSAYRAVRVRILRHDPLRGLVELAQILRIFAYVPQP